MRGEEDVYPYVHTMQDDMRVLPMAGSMSVGKTIPPLSKLQHQVLVLGPGVADGRREMRARNDTSWVSADVAPKAPSHVWRV